MKNANFMASLKAFFGKAWTATKAFSIKAGKWIVANKLISIPVAVVLVGGIACAIALPIALHEHDFATEWSTDADNHWHNATCSHEEEKADFGAHVYDNACDTTCNTCGAVRTVGAHVYDNACDTTCNNCGATRAITHDHADTLTVGDTTHYYLCSVCGDKKDEVAHVFDRTVASSEYLKAVATETTKAQYYKSCVCGKASATEYFETDKAPANLQVADISKTYDGTPVSEPEILFDGVGGEMFEYWQGTTKLAGKPTDAGTYKVIVTIFETETHAGDRVEREFTIAKKVLSNVNASVIYDGSTTFGEITLAHDGIVAGDVIIADIDVANKNVGVYTGTGAVFAILDVLGNGAANYEINEQTTEVTVTPKVLSNLSFEFVYRGESNFETDYLTEAQGILAADVADGNFIFVQFDSKNVGATVTDAEIDFGEEADSYENYEIDMATFTASIVPKKLSGLTVDLPYAGTNSFEVPLGEVNGIVAGDVADGIKVSITFASKNVGAAVTGAGLDADDGDNYTNYELDLTTCTASIVKRPVWATENVEFTYDGYDIFCGDEYPIFTLQNVVSGETIDLGDVSWCFDSKNVGATLTAVELTEEYNPNYTIDFSKCSASIIPRVIDNLTYAFEYNGMEYRQAFISRNEHSGIVGADEITLEVCFATPNVGSALDTSEETGFEPSFAEENYVLGENYSFSIVPKKLTNLHLYITSDTYESGEITLLEKDGVVAGESVKVSITNFNDGDYDVGFEIFMELADGTSPDGDRYETIALIASGDYANYELATYDDGRGYQVVGILEIVA